jgi:hypothetical protein
VEGQRQITEHLLLVHLVVLLHCGEEGLLVAEHVVALEVVVDLHFLALCQIDRL